MDIYMFASGDAVVGMAVMARIAAFYVILGIAVTAAIFGLLDLKRFGRSGAPWGVAIFYGALFSSAATWLWGIGGILPGLVCVWAFALGRNQFR
jgi:hypothetical protein